MHNLTEKIDELFAQNRGKEAEALMEKCLKEALQAGNLQEAVPILNELIGYCRETSQVEKSYDYGDLVLKILDKMELQGTIPYATTLLNIANAYRAGGRLDDSLNMYEHVEKIYRQQLLGDDMLIASLYNNMSLLYQEMGRFDLAKIALLTALAIVEKKEDAVFEVAVTYANLASTCLSLGQESEAETYFIEAIRLFEENLITDTHYCAALSALATYHYRKSNFETAEQLFLKAMSGIEQHLGRNEYYQRMQENAEICRQAVKMQEEKAEVGLDLCRAYYEAYGRPMLEKYFPEYLDRIAVGLVGEGSDCFGYDDEISRDHDWGPGFNLWVSAETYAEIGSKLQAAYDALPKEFKGYVFRESVQGRRRRGVHAITDFYRRILGEENFPEDKCLYIEEMGHKCIDSESLRKRIRWQNIEDYALAAAVNGEIFADSEGIMTGIREVLEKAYPDRLRYLKIAQATAKFCQNGQYNVERMLKRGDKITSRLLLGKAVEDALKLLYYVDGAYPPHDKWLLWGLKKAGKYAEIVSMLEQVVSEPVENTKEVIEQIAEMLAQLLYQKHYISDTDSYLENHVGELLFKTEIVELSVEELAERIARLEFEAFDKVKNLGGRADCQDDWFTFSVMRKSQYFTWNKVMLMQYYYDFTREYQRGHNLIEEKYGRMMESTAPDEYASIADHFPVIDDQKKAVIEAIVEMQVSWMEAFADRYPQLAGNARSIHTYEDNQWNTSYETYLRGEISTYSDKMLQLYGQYIVELSNAGENLARRIMEQSVLMYGYEGLEEAESRLKK